VGETNHYAPRRDCTGRSTRGPERVYSITVPDDRRLNVRVIPDPIDPVPADFADPAVYLLRGPASSCDLFPLRCLTGDDSGLPTATNAAGYANVTGAPETVFVVVDTSTEAPGHGTYSLEVAVDSIAPGEVCAKALPLSGPGSVAGDTSLFANDYQGSECTTFETRGPDVVYSIVVPAGQRLVATAEPEAGSVFAPAIYLIRAPSSNCNLAPKPCLAGDDQGGRPSRVTYANTSMADETVFVVIDG